MNFLTLIIYQPIFNSLLFVQKFLPGHDLGVAIIIITLVIKTLLFTPSLSAIRASRHLQELQPKLKALQEKYKNNKEELAKEQMKLYKDSRVNPLSSCLPTVLQLVVFIYLYQVFINGLKIDTHGLLEASQVKNVYPALRDYFTTNPINTMFLNFVDLTKAHNIILAVLAGASQFWQSRMLAHPKEPKTKEAKDESMTSALNQQMTYILPVMMAYFGYRFPAGLALYWIVSTMFTIGQQYYFIRRHPITPATPPANPPPEHVAA